MAGEIAVIPQTAALLPPGATRTRADGTLLLRWRRPSSAPPTTPVIDLREPARRGCCRRSSPTTWRPGGPNPSTGSGASRSCASPVPTRCSRSRVPRWSPTPSTGPSAPSRTRSSPSRSRCSQVDVDADGGQGLRRFRHPVRERGRRRSDAAGDAPHRRSGPFRCRSRWASTGATCSWPRSGPPAGRRTPRWATRRTPRPASPPRRPRERSTPTRRCSSTPGPASRQPRSGRSASRASRRRSPSTRSATRSGTRIDRHQGATAARRPRPGVGRPRGHARGRCGPAAAGSAALTGPNGMGKSRLLEEAAAWAAVPAAPAVPAPRSCGSGASRTASTAPTASSATRCARCSGSARRDRADAVPSLAERVAVARPLAASRCSRSSAT